MSFMNGLLMGIGAAGMTYGENRVIDQREAMKQQAEIDKEKRILEATRADASLARQQHLTDYQTLKSDKAKEVLLAHDVAAQDRIDTDNYKYDPVNAKRAIEYEGALAKAKSAPESESLVNYRNAQIKHLEGGIEDGGGWSKSDTGTLNANNKLEDNFTKQIKGYDDAIEGAASEEEKIALQASRITAVNNLAKVQSSTQALVDQHTQPSGNNASQQEIDHPDKADISGIRTKMAYDTITEMTKDGKIKPPEINDMTLADMTKWIADNKSSDIAKKPDIKAEDKSTEPLSTENAQPGLLNQEKKHGKGNEEIHGQAEYLLNHGANSNSNNHGDIERASQVEAIRENTTLSKEGKLLAIQDIIEGKTFGGMLKNGAKSAYGVAKSISDRITDNAKSAISDYTQ